MESREDEQPAGHGSAGDPAARMAVTITVVVLLGIALESGAYVLAGPFAPWQPAVVVAALAAIVTTQLAHSFPWLLPRLSRRPYWTLAVQAACSFGPLPEFHEAWLGLPAFLAASALLVLPPAVGRPLFAVVLIAADLLVLEPGHGWNVILDTISLGIGAFGVFSLSRMAALVAEVRQTRTAVARLAVVGERLQFARDLQDLLGSSLSAITLKCELVHRMIGTGTEAGRKELTEILRTSRQALADVRTMARGYREMSLTAEVEAADSMLAAVGIRTAVRLQAGTLPAPIETVLAAVLREGLTNMLHHSRAERCRIQTVRRGPYVVFSLAYDGSRRGVGTSREGVDSTVASLKARVAAVGGTLTAGEHVDGWFTVKVVVTLAEGAADDGAEQAPGSRPAAVAGATLHQPASRDPASRDLALRDLALHDLARRDLAPRSAATIMVGLLLGYCVLDADYMHSAQLTGWHFAAAVLLLVVMTALQTGRSFPGRLPWLDRRRYWSLGLQAVLTFAPFAVLGAGWLGLPGFLVGSVLLLFPPRAAWPLFGCVLAANAAVLRAMGFTLPLIAFMMLSAVICGLVVFGLSRMMDLAGELHRSRVEQTQLMVADERLRFARDLHDLMGLSLSTITLKCELAYRLVLVDPDRAKQELTEILDTAHQALADVRAVARGYRQMCLEQEVETGRSLLASVDIQVSVDLNCGPLPPEVDTVLATVLREGLTNLLRHSKAGQCTVTGSRNGNRVLLVLANDGIVQPSVSPPVRGDGGSGLGNLATRVSLVNGMLTAGIRADGWFQLAAEIVVADEAVAPLLRVSEERPTVPAHKPRTGGVRGADPARHGREVH